MKPKTPGEAAFAAYFQEMDWKDRSVEYCTVLHPDIRGAWEKAAAAAIAHHEATAPMSPARYDAAIARAEHLEAERDALAARVAALEGALQRVLDISRDRRAFVMMGPRAFAAAEQVARAALAGGKP